ncbi:DUF5685 family protein [Oscillibacter sp.]|uniref:DUF5685 family protein n=1 Tax=Oscillibacter sp. TaxID=1945593 RepID=UPI00257D52D9|nr:DUF5685 family protein [Oscillibacter sp.]
MRRRVLEQMLYHLGRWVYLIDAADDLQKDAVSGNYNPVALRYGLRDGKWDEESRRAFARTLDHSIHMIATAFELWDFGVWRPCWRVRCTPGFCRGPGRAGGHLPQNAPQRTEKETQEG